MNSRNLSKVLAIAALLFGALFAHRAHADVITGLFNTGLGPFGAPLPPGDGQTDANYTITGSSISAPSGNAVTYFNSSYAPESSTSRWVSLNSVGGPGGETVDYS